MAILADQDKNKKKGSAPDAPVTGTGKRKVAKATNPDSQSKTDKK